MNEKELSGLMQNLDHDLIEKEIDELANNIDIDMESISAKAHEKLKKENLSMRKRKRYLIAAAALAAALSVSAAYASEISDFVKSFFNKREIYSTVADGDAFYLEAPVQLDENNRLESVIFTKGELTINLTTNFIKENAISESGISIVGGNKTYIPGGYGIDKDTYFLSFYNETDYSDKGDAYVFFPTGNIEVNIGNASYYVELSEGELVTANGEIKQAKQALPSDEDIIGPDAAGGETDSGEQASPSGGDSGEAGVIIIDWVNVGFKETDKGVQILTSFEDDELELVSLGTPSVQASSFMNDFENGIGSGTSSAAEPLLGYGRDGNVYEFDWDRNALGRPVTVFESDAPSGMEIELIIPSLVAEYNYKKEFPAFNIDIPDLNQEITLNKEIDFIIQKMVLRSIKRTSETTAELTFDLNTGDKKEASIRGATAWLENIKKAEGVWDGDIGTMTITFDKELKSTEMSLHNPNFVINGNWSLLLNGNN